MIRSSMDRRAIYTRHTHHPFGLRPVCSALRSVFKDGLLTCNVENLINAMRELGIETSYDQASGFALGGYFCPHNQDPADQTRSSAKEAYYDTAKNRSNLEIITGLRVTRILTSNKSGSLAATGVEVSSLLENPARSFTHQSLLSLHLPIMPHAKPFLRRRRSSSPPVPYTARSFFRCLASAIQKSTPKSALPRLETCLLLAKISTTTF
jgi:hypothetical protein